MHGCKHRRAHTTHALTCKHAHARLRPNLQPLPLRGNGPLLAVGLSEDSKVDGAHDDTGNPEGDAGGDDGVDSRWLEIAGFDTRFHSDLLALHHVEIGEDREVGQIRRQNPNRRQKCPNHPLVHNVHVAKRVQDGRVSVVVVVVVVIVEKEGR